MAATEAPRRASVVPGPAWLLHLLLPWLLVVLPVRAQIDLQMLDVSFRLLRRHAQLPAVPPVVLIGLDEASLRRFDKPLALITPEIAGLVDAVRLSGARAIGLDVVLPEQSYERLAPGAVQALAASLHAAAAAMPVALGVRSAPDPASPGARMVFQLAAGPQSEAYLQVLPDPDGVQRRLDSRLGADGAAVPLLATRLASALGASPRDGIVDFRIGAAFDYQPAHAVLAWHAAGMRHQLDAAFRGRVVLIGTVLPDTDRYRLPVPLTTWEHGSVAPGLVFQGQALRSELAGRMVSEHPALSALACDLLLLLCWPLALRPQALSLLAALLALAVLAASPVLLAAGHWVAPAIPLASLLLATAGAWAVAGWREHRERARVQALFRGYVSPAMLDTLLAGPPGAGVRGERREVAFLFADIRGFTAFADRHDPEAVVDFLNRYYAAITPAVHAHGGTFDKFSGDGCMVFFGAPLARANPSRDALEAALAMLAAVRAFSTVEQAAGSPAVQIGIGVAAGTAVLGNIGAPDRYDYTATGPAINLAAHLQQQAKQLAASLVVEAASFDRAGLAPDLVRSFERRPGQLVAKHGVIDLVVLAGDPAGG